MVYYTWKAVSWIQPCWLTLAPDLLFHAERRKKKFWESPSLTFMGNLLAHIVFFSFLRLKHILLFLVFHTSPSHTSHAVGCFGKSLIMGSLSIVCLANCNFSPLGSRPLHSLEKVGVTVWCYGVFFLQNALCFQTLFSILDRAKRNNRWNTSTMQRMQKWKAINRFSYNLDSMRQTVAKYCGYISLQLNFALFSCKYSEH